MKKVRFLVLAAAGTALLSFTTENNKKAEDLDLTEIETPCGCVDALDVVTSDIITYIENSDVAPSKMTSGKVEKLYGKFAKSKAIDARCFVELEFNYEQLEECDNFNETAVATFARTQS